MVGHDIIVIGASAGGVETLKQLVSDLPPDIPAAIFMVLHVSPHGTSVLPDILRRAGKLPAVHAKNGQLFQNGTIYIAPPDHQLIIKPGHVKIVRGPKENGHRPAVDVLFRTAARIYRKRVIGVVLSGVLDDGSAGCVTIKAMGGTAIVQDPDTALYADMPRNAMEAVKVDHVVPVEALAALLMRLSLEKIEEEIMVVDDSFDVAEIDGNGHQSHEPGGTPSLHTCPHCGGVLSEFQEGDLLRFRCHVGHAFSAESLMAHLSDELEDTLWIALRTLEESVMFTRRLSRRAAEAGHERVRERYEERANEMDRRAALLRRLLLTDEKPFENIENE